MIIKKSKNLPKDGDIKTVPKDGDIKTVSRFAFFPTKTFKGNSRKSSEWIWLEEYISTYKYEIVGTLGWWSFVKRERIPNAMLSKLEE